MLSTHRAIVFVFVVMVDGQSCTCTVVIVPTSKNKCIVSYDFKVKKKNLLDAQMICFGSLCGQSHGTQAHCSTWVVVMVVAVGCWYCCCCCVMAGCTGFVVHCRWAVVYLTVVVVPKNKCYVC